jgi:uncharacterized membrane protein
MTWSPPFDGQSSLVLAAALAALVFVAFRSAPASGARSGVLLALRAAAVSVLVLILLNPLGVREEKRAGPPPTAVFLLDESRSMSLEAPTSRAQAVDQLIRRCEQLLTPDRRPIILKYGFGRDLAALSQAEPDLRPSADETRLTRALEQLPSRFGNAAPFGVFVFSDGRSTEPDAPETTATAYRALGVPIHVVPAGDPRIAGDVAVQDIDAPRDARPGTRVPVRITLRSRGYAGRRTEVSIRPAADPKRDPLARLPVTLVDGEQAQELVIDSDWAKGGLTAQVDPLPHEAIAANNRVPFQITPRADRLRVIYMEGSAVPEYRFIQDALEEDPDIECVSMYVDNQYVARPQLHRVDNPWLGFPTSREELLDYDVIICSDIARAAFTPEQLAWTVELVGRRGGGFVMIGGHTSFGAGGWDQTVWDGLIPVDMSGNGTPRSRYYDGSFRIAIPPQAAEHPIWRIVDGPARNRQVLRRMPMFHGTNLIDRLKPAATALGLSEGPLPGSGVVTVFSCQNFGRGRTFAMATDSTIAWGSDFEKSWGEGDNRYFRKFWRNVVRWLTENSQGSNRRIRAETDRIIYRPGQEIQLKVRAFDDKLVETDRYRVAARLRAPGDDESQPSAAASVDLVPKLAEKTYLGKLAVPPADRFTDQPGTTLHKLVVEVAALDGEERVSGSRLDLQVIDDPAEFRDPRPDPAALVRLAQATGGTVIRSGEELSSLLARHKEATIRTVVTRWPLWDTPLIWLALLGLLSAEWVVRRLKGLA